MVFVDNFNIKRNSFNCYAKDFLFTGFSPDINSFAGLQNHFVLKLKKNES